MKVSLKIALLLLLVGTTHVSAASPETGFLNRHVLVDGVDQRFQVYVPRNYQESKAWPVVLFLHGAGERGSDGLKQTEEGLGRAIRLNPQRWPAIVVFPQCPEDELWMGATAEIAMSALNVTLGEFSVDESRIYLTGLSLGGNGTWYLGHQYPERFAALVPIAGYVAGSDRMGIPAIVEGTENPHAVVAQSLAQTPVWIVHGDVDPAVRVEEARKMNKELQALGADVIYSELPGVGHNSWDAAYANDELITWLFSQKISLAP
jgi:predicted peptidase